MPTSSQPLRHIVLNNQGSPERFTTPNSGGRQFQFKPRDRQQHGQMLLAQLQEVGRKAQEQAKIVSSSQVVEKGCYLEFESDLGYDLKVESLKDTRQKIKLVTVSESPDLEGGDSRIKATVFVPEGKVEYFIKKVEKYLDPAKNTAKGNPANQPLINSISTIRLATLKSFWTDNELFPQENQEIWWETWLRTDQETDEERKGVVQKVRRQAAHDGLQVKESEIVFPDTTVILVRGNASQLTYSLFLLNAIAEIRRAKETAEYFVNLKHGEQKEWAEEALSRITEPIADVPAVCLLDTGVNQDHPLLKRSLSAQDMDSFNPSWGKADHHGHGTELAGVGLYGDLTALFLSSGPINLTHKLESVKLVPPSGQNDPELYGKITVECMARAEVFAPTRQRAYCLATSAKDSRDRGRPSSWSAAIDQFVSGAIEQDRKRRLILIAAGNADPYAPGTYPDKNLTDEVHDPGQSWNALTVGAYTEKDSIDPNILVGWTPLAPRGALCPTSTTSRIWESKWPFKPDVVFEGGNMATHPDESSPDFLDTLQLLTTHKDWRSRLFTVTGDTSGATALAARMCAQIMAEYPQFWPETIRGLLAHSAEWTSAMCPFPQQWPTSKQEVERILRIYGYGVPKLERALYSARNSLTLIVQDSIQPFFKDQDGTIKPNEMKLHALPWPREVLAELGETIVEMKVTLSYFIEPKPERNQTKQPSGYRSHGLRFDAKAPTETSDQFRQRINKAAREEASVLTSSDADKWLIGPKLRNRGSLHSDSWRGTAVELAEKGHVAVYPVVGWWKELRRKEKYNRTAQYSLIVTIKTPDVEVDLYTPVSNLVLV